MQLIKGDQNITSNKTVLDEKESTNNFSSSLALKKCVRKERQLL